VYRIQTRIKLPKNKIGVNTTWLLLEQIIAKNVQIVLLKLNSNISEHSEASHFDMQKMFYIQNQEFTGKVYL